MRDYKLTTDLISTNDSNNFQKTCITETDK